MPQGGLLNKGVSPIASSSPTVRAMPLAVLKVVLATFAMISLVAGCDPPTSATDGEVSPPRQTVVQVTRAPDPTATATPSVEPSKTPSPTQIVSPAPVSSPTAETLGQTYYVGNTDGDGVFIRRTREMDDKIKAWPDGTAMIELTGASEAGNRLWRHVRDPDGNEGYVPAEYLVVAIAKPTLELPRQDPVPTNIPDYDRDQWGGWVDADGDCQDTRQEVLIAESTTQVTFETAKKCRVASGTWDGPFTGRQFNNPSKLDIDHMVPLANAHDSGAWGWGRAKKRRFANDLSYDGHLNAVFKLANRSKGRRGPEEWKPPDQSYWCEYATHWIYIKVAWDLTATERELAALKHMLDTCESPPSVNIGTPAAELTATPALPTATRFPPTATTVAQEPTATAVPATATPPATNDALALYDDNGNGRITCAEARRHGIAPVHRGHIAYPFMDDRDNDGVVCE